jgi:hypothetical protein
MTGDGYTGTRSANYVRTLGGSAIVSQQPGSRTGDTVYETADGRRWSRFDGQPRTGDTVSSIRTEIR